jgi:cyanophycinase-like exopeptidase
MSLMTTNAAAAGTVTVMGSGEMMEVMGKVHRAVMGRIAGPVRPVFLDTPAGFQLNADDLSEKAIQYFQQRFDLPLEIVSFKNASAATPAEVSAAIQALTAANYIFAGPGSPTYAVHNWLNTPLHTALVDRFTAGAHVVFASAAAITLGHFMLPVYEIYKVGADPYWETGLDLLEPFGLDLAIVPHWNNAEGRNHDTRFCFMGEPRLKLLEGRLPPSTVILGVDEYTACTIDLQARRFTVAGSGQVTVRHEGHAHEYLPGVYPLTGLEPTQAPVSPLRRPAEGDDAPAETAAGLLARANLARVDFTRALAEADFESAARQIDGLLGAMGVSPISGAEASLPQQAQDMLGELIRAWDSGRSSAPGPEAAAEAARPYVELLVDLRTRLRASKQWALADEVRDSLAGLGVTLEDTSEGTTWRAA